MGLFSKSLEEKKLKELTGGFLLNKKFKSTLKKAGIDLKVGFDIQETLKNEIRLGKLSVNDIEERLNYLIDQFSSLNSKEVENPVIVTSPKERTLKFLINQDHNVKICKKCGAKLLKTDTYCYECGFEFDMEEEKVKINLDSELNDLEKSYNEKILHKNDNNLLFAYVVYLDYLNKNKTSIPQDSIDSYNVNLNKLERKAISDRYVTRITDLENLTVSELKEILKTNNLKVSGRKDELIERITLNKVAYSDKKLSKSAIEFIESNKHILFYNSHPELKPIINVDKYADIFENQNKTNSSRIQETIIEFLNTQEYHTLTNYEINRYKSILTILSDLYEMNNDVSRAIETYFKIFIVELNNFKETSKKAVPQECRLNGDVTDNLIDLLENNSIGSSELKRLFNESYRQLEILDPVISAEESLVYFLKIFHGEDIEDIERSIHLRFI